MVAYAEQIEETEDIMKVELGNFPAGETLKICFKYIVKLDVVDEALWSFIIPSTLTPRYKKNMKPELKEIMSSNSNLKQKSSKPYPYISPVKYTWEIDVNVYWPGGAKSVRCLSHKDKVAVTK